jgi:hypothetical protein
MSFSSSQDNNRRMTYGICIVHRITIVNRRMTHGTRIAHSITIDVRRLPLVINHTFAIDVLTLLFVPHLCNRRVNFVVRVCLTFAV